ncbi:hypothetical protein [Citricoccus alkalitolerans]|uniref:Integral membrane protein n=1 Tax=Citricoccus alkalitolerans TaxID=246603 RepID=A0ABV8XYZ2_9MICC
MEVVTALFVAIHIISAAAIVGGWLAHFKNPTVTKSQWWGSWGMIVSGLLLAGLAEMGDGPVNHAKIGVKLVVGLGVFITALLGRRKENKGEPVSTGLAHATGGLGLINILIAVLWQDFS